MEEQAKMKQKNHVVFASNIRSKGGKLADTEGTICLPEEQPSNLEVEAVRKEARKVSDNRIRRRQAGGWSSLRPGL